MKKQSAQKKRSRKLSTTILLLPLIAIFFLALFIIPATWNENSFCANSISCVSNLSGTYEREDTAGVFHGQNVTAPQEIASEITQEAVLGDTTEQKRIFVDLGSQHIYAYEGNRLVYDFLVSTGKWGKTPTGTFKIWVKLRYTRMSGGNPLIGTYYNLPNVPYTMFYYNNETPKSQGYSIHGAYWHNNFGHPMSHGCINMRIDEAEKMYNWALPVSTGNTTYVDKNNPGTEVVIYGTAPKE